VAAACLLAALAAEPVFAVTSAVTAAPIGRVAVARSADPVADSLSGEALDAATARVAAELRCPVCRGQSVLESSAELARQMQRTIRERLAAGDSPEEVKQYFVGRYGDFILLKPRARGIGILVYALPAAALLLGGLLLRRRLGDWVTRGSKPEEASAASGATPGATHGDDLSAEDRDWIERQIRGT